MTNNWILIGGLAIGTFAIRYGGFLIGSALPDTGIWARTLAALPGCLLSALLAVILVQSEPAEWIAALIALGIAIVSRSLPLTMLAGIASVWLIEVYV